MEENEGLLDRAGGQDSGGYWQLRMGDGQLNPIGFLRAVIDGCGNGAADESKSKMKSKI
jgi:hypothetical protein